MFPSECFLGSRAEEKTLELFEGGGVDRTCMGLHKEYYGGEIRGLLVILLTRSLITEYGVCERGGVGAPIQRAPVAPTHNKPAEPGPPPPGSKGLVGKQGGAEG